MKSFAIGSLNFITNNVVNPNFILQTPIEGLESPEYRTTYYDKPGQDGGNVSSQFYGKRSITLTGIVYANDPATFETSRQTLSAVCAITKDSSGYPIATRVTFTTLAGNSYYIDAYLDQPIFAYDSPNMSRFQITMTATNSFIQGSSQATSGQIVRSSGGGFILPVTLPIVSSAGAGGSGTITNTGNASAYPILTLIGPLTSPYIQNATVNKYMQLNYTLPSGSTITIDMANRTITLNGSSSLLSAKATGSDWWPIVAGANTINLQTSSSSDSGTVELKIYPSYLGV